MSSGDEITLTVPGVLIPVGDVPAQDRAWNAIKRARVLGADVTCGVSSDGEEWAFTIRAAGSLEQLKPLTGWLAEHDYPSPLRAASPPPSDEQVRAFLERHPAAFRGFADRERRRDPGWVRGMFRRDARIHGGRAEWPD